MSETAITELEELDAQKVSGVGSPANGTPWVILKALDPGAENAPGADSPEADAQEEEMTKSEADEIERLLTKEMGGYCGSEECEVCKEHWGKFPPGLVEKAKLKAKARAALPKSAFALPEKRGYPIHDENHARAALSMLHNASPEEQKRIKAAVHRRYPDIGAEKEQEPVEKSPGVPDESVATPTERGQFDSGQSGLAGPMTAGERPQHTEPAFAVGGQSSYEIPAEATANAVHNPSLVEMDHASAGKSEWDIEVVDKQNWMSLDEATEDQSVGGEAWEELDAAVLDSAIHSLASAWTSVSAIRNRERAEATKGTDPSADFRVARDRLNELLGEGITKAAENGANTSEEESIMATVTKEELTQFIADASSTAATAAVKGALKEERKAQKAKMKAKMKGKKPNPFAEKNANNNGDISEGTMQSAVHGQHDANDVNSVPDGGHVDGQYVNKQKKVKKEKASPELQKMAADLEQLRAALERRPRSGGPVLDGQARGGFPAAEGRVEGTVTKSEGELKIETLQKQMDDELSKSGIEHAQNASHISQVLTLERLKLAHEQGRI